MAASMEATDVAALAARLRDEAASRLADAAAIATAAAGARDPGAAAAAWRPLLGTLRSLTAAFVHPANREAAEPALFDCLGQLLGAVTAPVRAGGAGAGSDRPELEVAGECFRCLRNACVQCPANQRRVREAGLITAVAQLLLAFPPPPSAPDEPYFTAARCCLQVLGNVAAGNTDTREAVWAATYPQLYLKFLQCGDAKTLDYSCMALHTCAGPSQVARLACDPPGVLIARALLALCSRPHLEWPLLMVTERFLKSSTLLAQLYEHLDLKLRLTLLDLLLASLAEESPSAFAEATTPAPAPFLMRLADELRTTGPAVLRLASLCAEAAAGDEEALLVARTLSVLCEATSEARGDSCLRDHPTLLAAAVDLLGECHRVGREGHNAFSLAQGSGGLSPAAHPAHGLKRDLVRLVGNLCFAHRSNQDQVRDLEGIPLILESTNIDDNNPFIAQWAVLAVRNLTQGNVENQEAIRRLERRGAAQSPLLGALGVGVEEREGRVYLKATSKTTPPS
uniref:Ataxin-10 n=1 Tax=Petromyzon marinus TaxID=7757 RepID=A0AAJ7U4C7_PETMA|nr:ataxin-10 [Petromyzon marinus]